MRFLQHNLNGMSLFCTDGNLVQATPMSMPSLVGAVLIMRHQQSLKLPVTLEANQKQILCFCIATPWINFQVVEGTPVLQHLWIQTDQFKSFKRSCATVALEQSGKDWASSGPNEDVSRIRAKEQQLQQMEWFIRFYQNIYRKSSPSLPYWDSIISTQGIPPRHDVDSRVESTSAVHRRHDWHYLCIYHIHIHKCSQTHMPKTNLICCAYIYIWIYYIYSLYI